MKSLTIKTAVIVLLGLLAACQVSKNVPTPAPELPATYRSAVSTDTLSVAALPWKNFFEADPELLVLIDSAIAHNFDMQLAMKNIEAARLTLRQSKLGYWPQVGLNVTGNYNRPSDNSLNGLSASSFLGKKHIEDYNANVGLSWEADFWGKVRNQKSRALAEYLQTEEARKAVQTDIVAGVAEGYYNLLMLDAQLSVARKNLGLNDSTLRIINLQFKAGDVTALGIQQAEAQRQAAAELVPQLEQQVLLQENAISILSGRTPDSVHRSLVLEQVKVRDILSSGVPTDMVRRRPDVNSSELDLTIANANVGISKASLYPSLVITASGGLNSFTASNWFNIPASLFGIVGGGLTQPVFQRRQLKTNFELAKIEREKTVIRFRQTVLVAVGEVSDALAKINKLKQQQEVAALRVSTLQLGIKNANSLFRNGMANYLEVITAQSNVLQGELELASVRRNQLSAEVELYRSLGGGWN